MTLRDIHLAFRLGRRLRKGASGVVDVHSLAVSACQRVQEIVFEQDALDFRENLSFDHADPRVLLSVAVWDGTEPCEE